VKKLKTVITIRIESYFVDHAYRLGLNISRISRNPVEEIINKSKAIPWKRFFSGVKECHWNLWSLQSTW